MVFGALAVSLTAVIGVGLGGVIRHTAGAATTLALIIIGGTHRRPVPARRLAAVLARHRHPGGRDGPPLGRAAQPRPRPRRARRIRRHRPGRGDPASIAQRRLTSVPITRRTFRSPGRRKGTLMNTSTMTTRQRTTDGKTMQAIIQDRYGEAEDVLRLGRDRPARDRRRARCCCACTQPAWTGASGTSMTGLPYPVRLAGYGIRAPKTPVRGREVAGRVEAVGTDVTTLHGRRRGVRHRRGLLRRVRQRPAGQARAQAGEPHLRPGRGRPRLRPDRPAGGPRPRARAGRTAGAGHRRVGRRRDVRRADRQGVRRGGHRRVQHRQGGPGPVHRRRPRHRLHPRGHRRRRAPLRRDPRHRGQPAAAAPPLAP